MTMIIAIRGLGGQFPKSCFYCHTRYLRDRTPEASVRVLRRRGSWEGSRRSRARESVAKSTFNRKTHMVWKTFFLFLPDGAQRLIFTMNYHFRDDQVFTILTPNWPTPPLAPGMTKGDPRRSQQSPGMVWRDSLRLLGEPIDRKTPDQPPLAAVMLLFDVVESW